jgi:hypothetical protein
VTQTTKMIHAWCRNTNSKLWNWFIKLIEK